MNTCFVVRRYAISLLVVVEIIIIIIARRRKLTEDLFDGVVEATRETIHIGEAAGMRVLTSHFKACGKDNWGTIVEAVAAIVCSLAYQLAMRFDVVRKALLALADEPKVARLVQSDKDVALARHILTVPINPEFGSLNLAQAVILAAYEWSRIGREQAEIEERTKWSHNREIGANGSVRAPPPIPPPNAAKTRTRS